MKTKPPIQSWQRYWSIALDGAGLVLLLVVIFALRVAIENKELGYGFDSDAVYPFLIAGDFLADPSRLFSWYLAPVFYVFPDLILALGIVDAGVPAIWQPIVFSVVLGWFAVIGGGLLVARAANIEKFSGIAIFFSFFVLIGALSLSRPGDAKFLFLITSHAAIHGGTLVAIFWSAWLLLSIWDAKEWNWRHVALSTICVISVFSDLHFFSWFVLPSLISIWIYNWTHQQPLFGLLFRTLAIPSGCAYLVEILLNKVRRGYAPPSDWSQLTHWWVDLFARMIEDEDFILLCWMIVLALHAVKCVQILIRVWARSPISKLDAFTLLLGLGSGASIIVPVLWRILYEPIGIRYFLFAFWAPMIWLLISSLRRAPALAALVSKFRPVVLIIAAFGAVVLLTTGHAMLSPDTKRRLTKDEFARCIRSHGGSAGLSDYWLAMSTMQATSRALHVVGIAADGNHYKWITNDDWRTRHAGTGEPVQFNFVVMKNLDGDRIEARYGTPSRRAECDGELVWFYDAPIDFGKRSE